MVIKILYLVKLAIKKIEKRILQHNNVGNQQIRRKFKYKKIDKKTVNIQITDNEMLMSIVGQFDQNLKNLANLLIQIFFLEVIQLLARVKEKI